MCFRQLSRKKYSTIFEMNFIFQFFAFSTHAIFQSLEKMQVGVMVEDHKSIAFEPTKLLFEIFKNFKNLKKSTKIQKKSHKNVIFAKGSPSSWQQIFDCIFWDVFAVAKITPNRFISSWMFLAESHVNLLMSPNLRNCTFSEIYDPNQYVSA